MAATFKIISGSMFKAQYEEAFECVDSDELDLELEEPFTFGEVSIPGHGKRGCLVMSSTKKPGWFYDEDDGWQRVPSGETFIEVTSTGKPKAARLNPRGPKVDYHL